MGLIVISNFCDSYSAVVFLLILNQFIDTLGYCIVPNIPLHTKHDFIYGDRKIEYMTGVTVSEYTVLEISCSRDYNIPNIPFAQNYSICRNGNWDPPLATCLRTCPSLTSLTSTNVKCRWNDPDGNNIPLRDCINPVEGTTVFLSCNTYFEESSIKKNSIRVCNNGQWNPPISACYPICGVKRPKGKTNIINGQDAEPGDYPWQVGVYNSQKELICGGSMLDYRVILSAAHCFTDYDGKVDSSSTYFVAGGKYYREYHHDRDRFAQYSKILKVYIPKRYKGVNNQQAFDIAIVILADPFEISLRVQPVCIELDEESPDLHFSINKIGIVTGWGYTQNGRNLSEVLKEVEIPFISYDDCYDTVPISFRRYIAHDKICGGYLNKSTSVCGGDSGGGFVFKKLHSDQHFIKGIVSVSPATEELVCDPNEYSVYTSVVNHIDFIRTHLRHNEIQQNIECIQNDCVNNDPINISSEKCSNGDNFSCTIFGTNCTLPNFALNSEYILNENDAYVPGGYVPINSSISVTCYTGFELSLSGATQSYCSDSGKWSPALKECTKPGYCKYDNNLYLKEGEESSILGICAGLFCVNATTNQLSPHILCEHAAGFECYSTKYDFTKLYPDCCPRLICNRPIESFQVEFKNTDF